MNLVVFDFDDTLCDGQSINGFMKLMMKKAGLKAILHYYLLKILNPYKSSQYPQYKEHLLKPFVGMPFSFFDICGQDYAETLLNYRMHIEVIKSIQSYSSALDFKLLSSGGYQVYLTHIYERLDFDLLHASEFEFIDGCFTGKIKGIENLENQKVENIKNLSQKFDKTTVYTDSPSDMPLINIADEVYIVTKEKTKPTWVKEDWNLISV
jgi:HAD superfamily phosphoserine phosphatase-like hydrolase